MSHKCRSCNYKVSSRDKCDECGRKRDANLQDNCEYKEVKTLKAFEEAQWKALKAFEEAQWKERRAFEEAQWKERRAFDEQRRAFDEQRNMKEMSLALFDATSEGNVNEMSLLLNLGVNPNSRDDRENTPLMIAASRGNCKAAELLLIKGADINLQCDCEKTALIYASCGNLNMVKLLLDNGANPDLSDHSGSNILSVAASWGNKEKVDLLIKAGANPDLKDNRGYTALDKAIYNNRIEVAELLKKYIRNRLVELLKSDVADMDGSNERIIIQFPTAGGHISLYEDIAEFVYGK